MSLFKLYMSSVFEQAKLAGLPNPSKKDYAGGRNADREQAKEVISNISSSILDAKVEKKRKLKNKTYAFSALKNKTPIGKVLLALRKGEKIDMRILKN